MRSSVMSTISIDSRPPGIHFPEHDDDVSTDDEDEFEEKKEENKICNEALDRTVSNLPFDPKAPPECSQVVKDFLKETLKAEIDRCIKETRDTERALHDVEMKRVKEENKKNMKDHESFHALKLETALKRSRKEHEMHVAILKEDHETELKNTVEELEELFQAEKEALEKRLKEEYQEKTKAFEARLICQRDKTIRRMAEQCDLQVKGLRDFYGRDREDALKALDKRWSDFVHAQRSHFLLDRETHETLEMRKCREEVNASKSRTKLLEKQLRRSVGVISETASSREMGHLKPSPLMRRFLRDSTTTRPTTENNTSSSALLYTPPRESTETKLSSPLRKSLLHDLGYENLDNLIDTAISETLPSGNDRRNHTTTHTSSSTSSSSTSSSNVQHNMKRIGGMMGKEEEFGTPRMKFVDLDL